MTDPGGQTGNLFFPLDARPGDGDPVECAQGVTRERDAPRAEGEDDDDRLVFHGSTLMTET